MMGIKYGKTAWQTLANLKLLVVADHRKALVLNYNLKVYQDDHLMAWGGWSGLNQWSADCSKIQTLHRAEQWTVQKVETENLTWKALLWSQELSLCFHLVNPFINLPSLYNKLLYIRLCHVYKPVRMFFSEYLMQNVLYHPCKKYQIVLRYYVRSELKYAFFLSILKILGLGVGGKSA